MKRPLKTYLTIPLALTMFLASMQVAAEETSTSSLEASVTDATGNSSTPLTEALVVEAIEAEAISVKQDNQLTQQASELLQEDVAAAPSQTAPNLQTIIHQLNPTDFQVTISGVPSEIERLTVPIWSEVNGQDDIKWYEAQKQADGSYQVIVSIENHTFSSGLYQIHYYGKTTSGENGFLGKTTYQQPQVPSLAINQVSDSRFQVKITDISGGYDKVLLPTWSEHNGQDDLRWYEAQKQVDGSYLVDVDLTNHQFDWGNYQIHLYGEKSGHRFFLTKTSHYQVQPEPQAKVTQLTPTDFQVKVSNIPSYFERVLIPTWSEVNGQDDIKWYEAQKQADGSYQANISIENHTFSSGQYHIHYYGVQSSGESSFIGKTTYQQPQVPNFAVTPLSDRLFQVKITDISTNYDKILLPAWSDNSGQDDLRWYEAQKQSDGSYQVVIDTFNHHLDSGVYQLHLYGEKAGHRSFLTKTTHTQEQVQVETKVTRVSDSQFAIKVTNVPNYITSLRLPVWSEVNGQDDLKWYEAQRQYDGSYTYTVNIKDHGYATGAYQIHVYGNSPWVNGIFLNGNTNYDVPSSETVIETLTPTRFKVVVKNVPDYVTSISLPVWSDVNHQDDIKWYEGIKAADGSYSVIVESKNHNYDGDVYHIHTYARTVDGQLIFLANNQTSLAEMTGPIAQLDIINVNKVSGTFDIVVSNIEWRYGVQNVIIPVWSELNGQDDLEWYQATKQSDGTYRFTVQASNHNYNKGTYHVHLYITDYRGEMVGVTGTTVEVDVRQELPAYFIDISSHNGNISVAEFLRLKSQGILGVVVKLTEGTSYTNPYAPSQIANAKAAGMKVSAYHYSHYTSEDWARQEARYFAQKAREFGLSGDTLMVNDIEEQKMKERLNENTLAWVSEMSRLGFTNNMYYTGANWLDIRGGALNTRLFGERNIWVAHYTKGYTYMDQAEAKATSHYREFGAWQYTSVSTKLSYNYLDENLDYTGRFTL
ncbi:GBS Bsp-like repeat-containing protein [Streptococcus plurextorum]|uniref:GBS Bsp-like repeat-containing protein n=1 Tax=Streptococcus plurextorum TaxID=456876 RepID=UPI0003F6DB9D|nr:GBS Bsp-like repeat-containing protein [Streptococcus plurextorum]